MKKLQISGKEFIRTDGLYYNLTDLFRLTTLKGISLEAWDWAKQENRTRDISRRGWFFKKSWAKAPVLIEYAKYLTPGMYDDVIKALNMDDPDKLLIMFGELKAAKLDYRVINLIAERAEKRERERKASTRLAELNDRRDPVLNLKDIPLFNADDIVLRDSRGRHSKPTPPPRKVSAPTRSMQMHRDGSTSVQHHGSDPLTQILVYDALTNHSSQSSHSSHRSEPDVCHTPSYSSHSSHDSYSSHSWSGDSGGSYDSGSSGGCD